MSNFKEIQKNYDSLKKEYPSLPEFSKMLQTFGYMEEDDVKSVVTLYSWAKKTPANVAQWIAHHLTPGDMLSANDAKFVKPIREDLLNSLKICASLSKKMSLSSFESTLNKNPEEVLAKTLGEAATELEPVVLTAKKMLKLSLEGWTNEEKEEEVNYRW